MSDANGRGSGRRPGAVITTSMIILILVALVVLGGGLSSFFQVNATEQAVVTRLGRFNRIEGPGLQFKLPFGLEQNYNVPTEVIQSMQFGYRVLESGVDTVFDTREYEEESSMLTGDVNIVDVEWAVQFRISDPRAWLFNMEDPEQTISDISKSVINRLVGDRSLDSVLTDARQEISVLARDEMNSILQGYELGVNITTVELKNTAPPTGRVEEAFKDVQDAQQDMERSINEGQQALNTQVPQARGERDQAILAARGYASQRTNEAQGDVARFLSVLGEYRNDPNTTRTRLYFEMMEDVFANAEGTTLVDRDLSNFIPLLNLDQNQGGAQ
jgi:membrane protease subunit HflK